MATCSRQRLPHAARKSRTGRTRMPRPSGYESARANARGRLSAVGGGVRGGAGRNTHHVERVTVLLRPMPHCTATADAHTALHTFARPEPAHVCAPARQQASRSAWASEPQRGTRSRPGVHLEHEHASASAFAEHKAISAAVGRPRGPLWSVGRRRASRPMTRGHGRERTDLRARARLKPWAITGSTHASAPPTTMTCAPLRARCEPLARPFLGTIRFACSPAQSQSVTLQTPSRW
jgi:hypothetical protein